MHRLLIFAAVLGLAVIVTVAQSTDNPMRTVGTAPETVISVSGDTSVRAVVQNRTIAITLRAIQFKKSDPGFPRDLDSYNEVSLLQQIDVLVDGHAVVVPRSAFTDLFNARKAWLASEKGLFVLCLGGGDGADLYVARIYFDSKVVHRRALFDATNQKEPAEETRYRIKVTFIG
jgi:hypothetical protein